MVKVLPECKRTLQRINCDREDVKENEKLEKVITSAHQEVIGKNRRESRSFSYMGTSSTR